MAIEGVTEPDDVRLLRPLETEAPQLERADGQSDEAARRRIERREVGEDEIVTVFLVSGDPLVA